MVSVGIDAGTQFIRIVVMRGKAIVATHITTLGSEAIENVASGNYASVLKNANLLPEDIACVAVTGIGREYIDFSDYQFSEAVCSARGVHWLDTEADVLLDMGTEKTMVVKIEDGKPAQILRNDRCASGTGRFLAITAKPLGVTPEELGELAGRSVKKIFINNNCAVFAESEIISLIHRNEQKEDIARAIFMSMAAKVHSLLIKVEPFAVLMMIGWLAGNKGMVDAVRALTGYNVLIPHAIDPQFVTALGAAVAGGDAYIKNVR